MFAFVIDAVSVEVASGFLRIAREGEFEFVGAIGDDFG